MGNLWSVEFLNNTVENEFDGLPKNAQAKLVRIVDLIEEFGLPNVGMPYLRHLQNKIWEMRPKVRDGIARALYISETGKRIIILRIFIKKTQKTPKKENRIALSRIQEIK